jgi:hypothetical protein
MQIPFQKILWSFLLAGFVVPCLLFSIISIGQLRVGGSFTWILLIPWPTFPLMMSAEAGGGAAGEFFAFFISTLANVVVYGVVGIAVAALYRRSRPK